MNFRSILNKRNYFYMYYLICGYHKSVRKIAKISPDLDTINNLSELLKVKNYEKIVVVASGPSVNNMIPQRENVLYLCTNNSLKLVDKCNFVYIVYDPFFLTKYLKKFNSPQNWIATIFWITDNGSQESAIPFFKIKKYFNCYSRNKEELLITNFKYEKDSNKIYKTIIEYIAVNFNFDFRGINSGFTSVIIGFVLAHFNNIPIEIYGFDMGEGGEEYFDKSDVLGKSIKGERNKLIVRSFLEKAYLKEMTISNNSNFLNYQK